MSFKFFTPAYLRKVLGITIVLSISLMSSCSVFRAQNTQFKTLLKEQLGITRILKGEDSSYCNVRLVNGDKIKLNQGCNFLDRASGDKQKIFVELKNGKIQTIQKFDTLIPENRIMREEWKIVKNGGELNFTTTDLQGKLIHFYGQVFTPGQHFGSYTETSIDSAGNSFTEWGVTKETAGTRRKNR